VSLTKDTRGRRSELHNRSRRSPTAAASHVTPASGNVFADLGFPPAEAEALKIRSDLMSELRRVIAGMTRVRAAELLGVSPQHVVELMRGHIDRFTIDALVSMLVRAGIRTRISLDKRRKSVA